jgi:hypothetical protein
VQAERIPTLASLERMTMFRSRAVEPVAICDAVS